MLADRRCYRWRGAMLADEASQFHPAVQAEPRGRRCVSILEEVAGTKPSVDIVVCVHNAQEYTRICLESVLYHTAGDYRLIVVNDGSDESTSAWLRGFAGKYPHVMLLVNATAQGYTRAANQGLGVSQADYVILLNSDTIVSPWWVERLLQCGESDPKIGIIGSLSNAATYQSVPEVFDLDGRWLKNELPEAVTVAAYGCMVARYAQRVYPRVPVANGFCFVIKQAVVRTIGQFDEKTFPRGYGEENDYCIRARDAGFEVAVADTCYIYHAVSKSFGEDRREALTHAAHLAICEKHGMARLDRIGAELRQHPALARVREHVNRLHLRRAWLGGA